MRSADDFFYKPYEAALQNPGADAKAMAYWSQPFVLEGDPNDSYRMIAYSVPLMLDGQVYGVLGIEVSTAYLADTCFPISELNGSEAGGYAPCAGGRQRLVPDHHGKRRALQRGERRRAILRA